MKIQKRFVAFILCLIIIVNFHMINTVKVFAHGAILNVNYDNCVNLNDGDGIDEMWYKLDKYSICRHLDDQITTIKYYFEESSTSGYTWTTDISESVANEIKNAYAESMKKWNNVYFYCYDDNEIVTKKKIINVIEGTQADHNLSIFPGTDPNTVAITNTEGEADSTPTSHSHYSKWQMIINVNHFYVNDTSSSNKVDLIRERTGAHELGHVFGLRDVDSDNLCNSSTTKEHHHELLMGYGLPVTSRQQNITYKDIAGVAINRGFHTDNDHKWLDLGIQPDGKYKLLCSICNGVLYVESLNGYSVNTYNSCNGNHTLTSGNMKAVACYNTMDYYKCKYCRYVAPFSSIVSQNYLIMNYSNVYHSCVNLVTGLEYTVYEEHDYTTYVQNSSSQHIIKCKCGKEIAESHNFTVKPYTNEFHKRVCDCGYEITMKHDTTHFTSTTGVCSLCGATVTIKGPTISPWSTNVKEILPM